MKAWYAFVAVAATVLAAALPGVGRAALTVLGYQPQLHDRFYVGADKDFIGDPYNWSGVGRASTGTNRWATMISDSYFLSANHSHPATGSSLVFYEGNNPSGVSWTGTVTSAGFRLGDTDLWIGQVLSGSAAPPSWVERYPLIKRPDTTNWMSYLSPELLIFGQTGVTNSPTEMRLGRNDAGLLDPNELSIVIGMPQLDAAGPALEWSYEATVPPGLGDDEALTQGGDSGGPTFVRTSSGPALAGIHWKGGLDTYLSSLISEIDSAFPSSESFVVRTDLIGDLDADFDVDLSDLTIFGTYYGATSGATYSQGDLDGDGDIDLGDLTSFGTFYDSTLRAPADFNGDMSIDGDDFHSIAVNWLDSVTPSSAGDASRDGVVDEEDVAIFADNWAPWIAHRYVDPPVQITGDANFNGGVDADDVVLVQVNFGRTDVTPYSNGDVDGDGDVDLSDLTIVGEFQGDSFADVNGDRVTDMDDFNVIAANWNLTVTGGRLDGDLDESGVVDELDMIALGDFWRFRPFGYGGVAAIPEPTSCMMLALSLLGWAPLRRRSASRR